MSFLGSLQRRGSNLYFPDDLSAGGAGSLTVYNAVTVVPTPPDTVMGAALAERNLFRARLKPAFKTPETFESISVGIPLDGVVITSGGGATAIFSFTPDLLTSNQTVNVALGGYFNTTPSGSRFGRLINETTEGLGQGIRLVFGSPLIGFGMYFTDIGDFGGDMELTFQTSTGPVTYTVARSGSGSGQLSFFGLIDTTGRTYSEVLMYITTFDDAVGIDDIYLLPAGSVL